MSKEDLEARLRDIIQGTCNTIGCKNCGLKWDGGCSAIDLQGKIMDIEVEGAMFVESKKPSLIIKRN